MIIYKCNRCGKIEEDETKFSEFKFENIRIFSNWKDKTQIGLCWECLDEFKEWLLTNKTNTKVRK